VMLAFFGDPVAIGTLVELNEMARNTEPLGVQEPLKYRNHKIFL
jgi:hypothetical protein